MLACIASAQATDASLRVFQHKNYTSWAYRHTQWSADYFYYIEGIGSNPYRLENDSTYYYNSTTSNKLTSTCRVPIDPDGDLNDHANYTDFSYDSFSVTPAPSQWAYHKGTEPWIGYYAGTNIYNIKTEVDLLTGDGHTNKTHKYILLSATATRLETVPDPNDPYSSIAEQTPIAAGEFTVNSKNPDIDNNVFLKTSYNQTRDVTPQMNFTTYSNHIFSIAVVPIKVVNLTRTFHPKFLETGDGPTLADIQAKFDEGTEGLARDDDDEYALNDPTITTSTNSASLYRTDDVPTYIEFIIHDVVGLASTYSYSNQVVQTTNKSVFPISLHGEQFYIISTFDDLEMVMTNTCSDIKQVKSFSGTVGTNTIGRAWYVKHPAQIAIKEDANAAAYLHEWGHSAGLKHRDEPPNYGPTSGALMNQYNDSNNWKVNRYEREVLLGY